MTSVKHNGKKSKFNRLFTPLLHLKRSRPPKDRSGTEDAKYMRMYECFREILSINDDSLQLIADIDDRLLGQMPFNLEPLFQQVRKAVMESFLMINNLNEIADGRYLRLHEALARIQLELEAEIGEPRPAIPAGYVVPLSSLRSTDAWFAGSKMANLGEIHSLGLHVPEGFVITTEAFRAFMSGNRLWEKAGWLECLLEIFSPTLLDRACREMQQAILAGQLPQQIENEIFRSFDELAGGQGLLVAMRSSAVGEDTSSSFAGKYYTELKVNRDLLRDSYRTVVSSMYNVDALIYRFERGLNDGQTQMAVGCIRMVDPQCSGIMFSREFHDLPADRVVISTRSGLNVGITAGTQSAEEITVDADTDLETVSAFLSGSQLRRLWEIARRLESHFGGPQDIEWAIDRQERIVIFQCRPMVLLRLPPVEAPRQDIQDPPILTGGMTACPGAGSGSAYFVRSEADLQRFPSGGVIVARHSSPSFSQVMTQCAAIIAEIGSPIGHMAILAREFGVPTIVGLKGAMEALTPGQVVSVDAGRLHVYNGAVLEAMGEGRNRFPLVDSPIVQRLRRVARLVTPLNLIDPSAPEFRPSGCRSLHDITRFVHEKLYDVMFHIGDRARSTHGSSLKLQARLPLEIRIFDVGGGLARGTKRSAEVQPDEICSVPMLAFLKGMLDSRIKWDEPRPVSARGFMSVMGENIAGPPAMSRGVGGTSFAVISDRYMNFSTKAGYHFSTLDVYCGQSQNKNYIHFKFHGGGATLNRRLRRITFLVEVLNGLEFRTQTQADFLVGRLDKYEHDYIRSKLVELGRLTMCVRQLDMLMDSDAKALALARAFLSGELQQF